MLVRILYDIHEFENLGMLFTLQLFEVKEIEAGLRFGYISMMTLNIIYMY